MMSKKLFSLLFVLAAAVILILSGCGNESSTSDETTPPSSTEGSSSYETDEGEEKEQSGEEETASIDYPTRAIEIIVSAGPGGGSDNFARAVAQELTDIYGVPVNVVNMPGANGAVARQEILNRPADGYTLLVTVSTFQTEMAQGKIENADKFEGLVMFHEDTYGLHVKGDGPYADIESFIEDAKNRPGELRVGGTYPLTLDELVVRKLEKEAGVTLTYVPYDSAGQMHSDLLGGHIEAIIDEFGPVMELIKSGDVKSILAFNEEKIEELPDVPTSVEKGFNITDGMNRSFVIHADTPQEIKDNLQQAMQKAYESERYKEFMRNNLLHLKEAFLLADDFNALIEKQVAEYKEIYKSLQK
jgi:putative tricarboxylic transport membrane protein